MVNSPSEPLDANAAWYTDSEEVESTSQSRGKAKTRFDSKSKSQPTPGKLTGRATWTPVDETDTDDTQPSSPIAVRSNRIVSPVSVERQTSWFAPKLSSLMVNNNNSCMLLDDLEPHSAGEDMLPAFRPAPTVCTIATGTTNAKEVSWHLVANLSDWYLLCSRLVGSGLVLDSPVNRSNTVCSWHYLELSPPLCTL